MSHDLSDAATTILHHLEASGRAELPGLGTLELRVRPERIGLDPINGAPLRIPERRVLVFVTDPEPCARLALTPLDADERGR